jgi:hypothetical protein
MFIFLSVLIADSSLFGQSAIRQNFNVDSGRSPLAESIIYPSASPASGLKLQLADDNDDAQP